MNAVTTTKPKANLRILSSSRLRDAAIAAIGALALAAAFPKIGAAWLVPLGTAALFFTWQGASWRRATLLGWFAGMIFFALGFSWVGHTVGSYIGVFGPFLMFGPALIEAPYFALAGALSAVCYRSARPAVAPLGAAAAFTFSEWLRSIGLLGAPFDQLGYTQADGPMRAVAAYAGTYGVTLLLCVLGAYLADAVRRQTWKPLAAASLVTAGLSAAAWVGWPARHLPAPTITVAAVQGNIAQSLKWNSVPLAIWRYQTMTQMAAASKPKLIVWPETVIPMVLNEDPMLVRQFSDLAAASHATIVVGSVHARRDNIYNSLFIFSPDGTHVVYDKRELVPFAETFPGRRLLRWLPYVGQLSGRFASGTVDGVYPTTALKIAPLICWESAFADLAFEQLRRGAQLLIVSTDDAWFGTTSGPYMHAQIAQLRAIESGAYVVRAAATGVSGIVAPDGRWQKRSAMERQISVIGNVGPPVPTVFREIGPTVVALGMAILYLGVLVFFPRSTGDADA